MLGTHSRLNNAFFLECIFSWNVLYTSSRSILLAEDTNDKTYICNHDACGHIQINIIGGHQQFINSNLSNYLKGADLYTSTGCVPFQNPVGRTVVYAKVTCFTFKPSPNTRWNNTYQIIIYRQLSVHTIGQYAVPRLSPSLIFQKPHWVVW